MALHQPLYLAPYKTHRVADHSLASRETLDLTIQDKGSISYLPVSLLQICSPVLETGKDTA